MLTSPRNLVTSKGYYQREYREAQELKGDVERSQYMGLLFMASG
jgi:hypothetical protein